MFAHLFRLRFVSTCFLFVKQTLVWLIMADYLFFVLGCFWLVLCPDFCSSASFALFPQSPGSPAKPPTVFKKFAFIRVQGVFSH